MLKPKLSLFLFMLLFAAIFFLQVENQRVIAQPRITNTPIPVIIPTLTATIPGGDGRFVEASPSPTFTLTPQLPDARLVAIVPPGEALVRSSPENGEIIGYMESGRDYQVTGQYFSWFQIQFAASPSGRAWVYIETIRVSGALDEIPYIDPASVPVVLFETPGFVETATEQARILTLPVEESHDVTSEFAPTYTVPAEIVQRPATLAPNVEASATPENIAVQTAISTVAEEGIPPIVPILVLGLFGTFGLLIALIRR
jgi:hypothetical protein